MSGNQFGGNLPNRPSVQYDDRAFCAGRFGAEGILKWVEPEIETRQQFRLLEHTADVGFEAFGANREEVFAHAARALFHLIVDLDTIDPRADVAVTVAGTDPESVLVNWLSELLYLHDAEGWLFGDFRILRLQDDGLRAVARGEKFNRSRHQAKLLVKAITYHQLALEKTTEGWRARVYVDI